MRERRRHFRWGWLPGLILSFLGETVIPQTFAAPEVTTEIIPLPEHPRPDFQRPDWFNLNGYWKFRFDPLNVGEKDKWFQPPAEFPLRILVPFSWGAPLSEVEDEAEIAWYSRKVRVPESWKGKRIFLVVGASDWRTSAWFEGTPMGTHQGGYTPFEFELTSRVRFGSEQALVLRVDDSPHPFKLEGKQGYGAAKGIWQTVYLEARGSVPIRTLHFIPDPGGKEVGVHVGLFEPTRQAVSLDIRLTPGETPVSVALAAGASEARVVLPVSDPHLWSLEDPFLYEADVTLTGVNLVPDRVSSYFGMRSIGVTRLPGSGHAYVSLNGRPVYLQLTLDQAYHPEGYYTFPSDRFLREEVLRSLQLGLNGIRVHVKTAIPRKLYWADRLGLLVMADVPNSWGEPTDEMRAEAEHALFGMLDRDFNHPSVFSWVLFNETWGLQTKGKGYLPETREWVETLYRKVKELDPTRLVEDNSPDKRDHVATDLNTWHAYLPGYGWKDRLDQITRDTFPGSTWNFVEGRTQGDQPMLNSECGNVWGYEGSAGDVDWSWDYHIMMNEFRRHPKICGWLYTEHHDVINEWNGYYRFDRSNKVTGLGEIVPGMTIRDFHSPIYVSTGSDLCRSAAPGSTVDVPLWVSALADNDGISERMTLRARLSGWDSLARERRYGEFTREVLVKPWTAEEIESLSIQMPEEPGLIILSLFLEDGAGTVVHRNFTTFLVVGQAPESDEQRTDGGQKLRLLRVEAAQFHDARWTLKQWAVLDGRKVNGAGSGYFEYRVPWPEDLSSGEVEGATFRFEASAKQLFGKDRDDSAGLEGDYMRGKGTHDPSRNPNAYPMTDSIQFPSRVIVRVNGTSVGVYELEDDPADHRGILSWNAQLRDRKLREAGSYGYLVIASIPVELLRKAEVDKQVIIRLEVPEAMSGGLAIYGREFGRYPLDPTLVLALRP